MLDLSDIEALGFSEIFLVPSPQIIFNKFLNTDIKDTLCFVFWRQAVSFGIDTMSWNEPSWLLVSYRID